jgi:molybdopterin/thiamine biosynthesis adenylyltransferase
VSRGGCGGELVLVGAGGLGGPLALVLGAGGHPLRIYDPDVVELSNLQRQVPFTAADLGQAKAERLASVVRARGGVATGHVGRWTAAEPAAGVAVIVDGSDDPATKFAVAAWAAQHGVASVIAGVLRYHGTVVASAPGAGCYRCLFEAAPTDEPSCADAGVFGPACGVVAAHAAALAAALAAGDRAEAGTAWSFPDLRTGAAPRRLHIPPRAGCPCLAAAPLVSLAPPAPPALSPQE